jgi:ATP-dependent DNA helicase RecG
LESSETILHQSLAEVPGLTSRIVKMLAKESMLTVMDVVGLLPFRHEDRRRKDTAAFHTGGIPGSHAVRVVKTQVRFFGRAGSFEAIVEHSGVGGLGQQLTLRWWNMPFMSKTIATDMELIVYGKIKEFKGRLFMDHPEYEVIKGGEEEGGASIHNDRIVPVYPLRGGLAQKAVRTASWHVMERLGDRFTVDILPPTTGKGEFAGLHRSRALHTVHFPANEEELNQSRRYLALEEFYGYQLRVVRRRRRVHEAGGRSHRGDGSFLEAFFKELPFELTAAQSRSLREIQADMASALPMNRLLHGDVGSGKTVVALAAMLTALESGSRAALMAPTQILAEQHYLTAQKWLEPLGVTVSLKTGTLRTGASDAQVLIGTHALLHDRGCMWDVGLVVIDEQHKFGVAQRARLIEKGRTPDVLVMTATPIPRTLSLTIYGDLDVSTIDERPKSRGKVITKVRLQKKMAEAAGFLAEQIASGRQGYLVFPLIEDSEKVDATAAKKGFAEWSKLLAPHTVGLLHGKMSAEEKESVMRDFREGKIQALVSTTVVEVGVDVPNATVMYIHNAERFGLAQLHQLRGRIGRGSHTSYCVLFVKDDDEEVRERLAILEETDDGFRIAEEDLKRRGPGDILGRAQSGEAPLQFAELLADTRLVRLARQLAERTLNADPELKEPRHAPLRKLVQEIDSPQAMLQ